MRAQKELQVVGRQRGARWDHWRVQGLDRVEKPDPGVVASEANQKSGSTGSG